MNLSGRTVIYDRILIVGFQISDFRSRDIEQAKTKQTTTGGTDNDRQAKQINKTEI